MFLLRFFTKFFPKVTQKHSYVQPRKHHIRNKSNKDKENHSSPPNSMVVLVHSHRPVFVKKEVKDIEKRSRKGLKVIDERISIENIHFPSRIESYLKREQQFSNLFKHDCKTKYQQQEPFNFDHCLHKHLDDILLVNENTLADVKNSYEPKDLQTPQN